MARKKKIKTQMRRFRLVRDVDVSGVSGTGTVVEGVEFANGKVAWSWLSQYAVVSVCDSMAVLEHIHGHEGKTKVEFYD